MFMIKGGRRGKVQRKTKRDAVLKGWIFDLIWASSEYELITLHVPLRARERAP